MLDKIIEFFKSLRRVKPKPGEEVVSANDSLFLEEIPQYEEGAYNWAVELKEIHEVIGSITGVKVDNKNNTITCFFFILNNTYPTPINDKAIITIIR